VFRPRGGIPGGNVFNDWLLLMRAMSGVEGARCWSSTTRSSHPLRPCQISAGNWPIRMVGGQITIVNQGDVPVFDMGDKSARSSCRTAWRIKAKGSSGAGHRIGCSCVLAGQR
jgi:hypothetical protein